MSVSAAARRACCGASDLGAELRALPINELLRRVDEMVVQGRASIAEAERVDREIVEGLRRLFGPKAVRQFFS